MNAVNPRTDDVPRSGSKQHETDDRTDEEQERHRAADEALDPRAALREPAREVDDERELRELRRVDGGQRADLEPARPTRRRCAG